MKKLLAVILVLVMVFALTACGGVDKSAVTDKFNEINTTVAETANYANEHLADIDPQTAQILNGVIETMGIFKEEIESDDLTQERADEIITELDEFPALIDAINAVIDSIAAQ